MVWYHKGNVKPEEEWPTDEYWREHWSNLHGSEEEPLESLESISIG